MRRDLDLQCRKVCIFELFYDNNRTRPVEYGKVSLEGVRGPVISACARVGGATHVGPVMLCRSIRRVDQPQD